MPDTKPLKALAKLDELLEKSTYEGSREPRGEAPNLRKPTCSRQKQT